jgi:hypothetical protein
MVKITRLTRVTLVIVLTICMSMIYSKFVEVDWGMRGWAMESLSGRGNSERVPLDLQCLS